MWKQRTLTLMGKSVLINSLLNSLFIFNAQIEPPPKEFVSLVEARNKFFLWDGGVAKIAHNSIIGEFTEGGMRYKDINSFVLSLNMKFIARIDTRDNANSTCIPRCWLLDMFTSSLASADQRYCLITFRNSIIILDCRFKLPKKSHWEGHPYYWELLVLGIYSNTDKVRVAMATQTSPISVCVHVVIHKHCA